MSNLFNLKQELPDYTSFDQISPEMRCSLYKTKGLNERKKSVLLPNIFVNIFLHLQRKNPILSNQLNFEQELLLILLPPIKVCISPNMIPTSLKKGLTNCDQLCRFWAIILIWNRRHFIRANHRFKQIATKIRLLLSQKKELKSTYPMAKNWMINIYKILST